MGNKQGGQTKSPTGGKEEAALASKPKSPPAAAAESTASTGPHSASSDGEDDRGAPAESLEMDLSVELGGGKGWCKDAHVFLYHPYQGLIVTGTEGGVIFVYGDGFQYMRTLPSSNSLEINEVSHLVTFHDDKVLAVFGNNAIYVLSLPLLNVVSSLEASWLPDDEGDVSTVHIDDTTLRNFAYIGTSSGKTHVLELLVPKIRICDYDVSLTDATIKQNMLVSDIMMCPKFEKYLAIAYDGEDATVGRVVIFDLVKKKPHRVYETSAVTGLCWNHVGDMLYAGTRSGEIIQLGLDKHSMISVWNSSSQYMDEDDAVARITIVRNMKWMAPQAPTEPGCLFVLIGSFGSDTAPLRSVIVALIQTESTAQLKEVLSIPPIPDEDVVGFRIAPSWDRSTGDAEEAAGAGVAPTPCLLLLTECSDYQGETIRSLKIIRCPVNPITMWELESAMLADPRRAVEVLPGLTPVTAISGLSPTANGSAFSMPLVSSGSTTQVLLKGAVAKGDSGGVPDVSNLDLGKPATPGSKGRRLSIRDLFRDIENMCDANHESWELVVCTGDRSVADILDTVVLGHADGTVVVWGVTQPPADYAGKEGAACGNSWIPLVALKAGSGAVSIVSHFADLGYLAAGDCEGNVVLWNSEQTSDESTRPECFRAQLAGEFVTAVEVTELAIFVGTKSGQVYACNGTEDPNLCPVIAISKLSGDLGAVTHMMLSPFWRTGNTNMISLYVSFSNGFVAVINAFTRELLGFAKTCIQTTTVTDIREGDTNALPCLQYDSEGRGYYPVRFAAVVTSKYELAADELKQVEVTMDDDEGDAAQSPEAAGDSRAPESDKRSSWLGSKMNRSSIGKSCVTPTEKRPDDSPRYYIQVCNTSVVRFDLAALTPPMATGSNIAKVKDESIVAQEGVSNRVYEFCDPIVAAHGVTYIEDAARFWASPFFALSCVDTMSNVSILSFAAHEVYCMCEANLLEKVSIEVSLMGSVVLQNGNIYMLHSDSCIFSASPVDKKYVPVLPSPVRLRTNCVPPHPSQLLLTGIEDGTLSLSKAGGAVSAPVQETKVKKRRSSILDMVSSAPAELDKLFLKTRTEIQKSELFLKEDDEDTFDSDAVVQKHSARDAIVQTQAINANVMDETRQAFEERGEKLSRVAKRSQELSDRSQEYRQNVHAHKEKLRKKAARWGLF